MSGIVSSQKYERLTDKIQQPGRDVSLERGEADPRSSQIYLTWQNVKVTSVTKPSLISKCREGSNAVAVTNTILNDVSGVAKPGDFIAIMGASGSGKTTMLRTLANRMSKKLEVSGDVRINGHTMEELGDNIKYMVGYVAQEDTFMPSMTVSEVMFFYANLLLEPSIPRAEKELMALAIMQKTGLTKVKDSRVGSLFIPGISGGEKRRLAVATQLILGASLLFLDEVTSGLDSFMAESIIKLIKELTESGCTILCTIHQPASVLYSMFDKVCLLSEGNIAFLGSRADALRQFEGAGHACPTRYSPADHFIYTLAIKPHQEEECRERSDIIVQTYRKSKFYQRVNMEIATISKTFTKVDYTQAEKPTATATFWTQFVECYTRRMKDGHRNPRIARARFVMGCIVSIYLGLFFLGTTNDVNTVFTNKSGLFFMCMTNFAWRPMALYAQSIPNDYPTLKREYQAGLYTTLPYYLSVILADLLHIFPLVLIEMLIFYFTVGLKRDAASFFTAYAAITVTYLASYSIGMFIGSSLEDPTISASLARILILPFFMMTGSVVKSTDAIPFYLYPFKYLSWTRYGYQMLMANEFTDLPLDCDGVECPFNGTTLLIESGIGTDLWVPNFVYNLIIALGFVALTCLMLPHKARQQNSR